MNSRPVLILSTMRSGSTLLKALLAAAPDVSDLPETDFQKFRDEADFETFARRSAEPILVFKRPAWLNEIGRYPKISLPLRFKKIMLVRDAYETVVSVRKMMLRWLPFYFDRGGNRFLAETYWGRVTSRLVDMAEEDPDNSLLVRYEELLRDPVGQTKAIFKFVGSSMTRGVDRYQRPAGYRWRWGKDDGGEKIQSLAVQKPAPTRYTNRALLEILRTSPAVTGLRNRLRYPALPPSSAPSAAE